MIGLKNSNWLCICLNVFVAYCIEILEESKNEETINYKTELESNEICLQKNKTRNLKTVATFDRNEIGDLKTEFDNGEKIDLENLFKYIKERISERETVAYLNRLLEKCEKQKLSFIDRKISAKRVDGFEVSEGKEKIGYSKANNHVKTKVVKNIYRYCDKIDIFHRKNFFLIFNLSNLPRKQKQLFIVTFWIIYTVHTPKRSLVDKLFRRTTSQMKERHAHLKTIKVLGIRNVKRRNRYAFLPIFQCTEIISVVFCIVPFLNTVVVYISRINGRDTPLHNLFSTGFYLSSITWISSILLHIDDNHYTRFMDYFSALLGTIYHFYIATLRLLISFKIDNVNQIAKYLFNLLSILYLYVIHRNINDFNPKALKVISGIFILLFLMALIIQYFFFHNKFIKYVVFFTLIAC